MKRYLILNLTLLQTITLYAITSTNHKTSSKVAHTSMMADNKALQTEIDDFIQELNKWEYIYDQEEGFIKKKVYEKLKRLSRQGRALLHKAHDFKYDNPEYYHFLIDALYELDVQYFKINTSASPQIHASSLSDTPHKHPNVSKKNTAK